MALFGLFAILAFSLHAQISERYQKRDGYHEGVKSREVGGYDIELVGAVVDVGEPLTEWPAQLSARFFLEGPDKVFLTVREWDPEAYYVLDKIDQQKWRKKATNVFSWPTVIAQAIPELRPESLIALVRLGAASPSLREKVAPVVLGPNRGSVKAETYRFTFLPNAAAKIRYRIFGPEGCEVLAPGPERRRSAEVPFDVLWKPGELTEGTYRLRVEGYFLNDNERILQEVEFYHASSWPS